MNDYQRHIQEDDFDWSKAIKLLKAILNVAGERYGRFDIDCPECGGKNTMTVDRSKYSIDAACSACHISLSGNDV